MPPDSEPRLNLVTGGSGFVGSHIVRALLERGESVRCLVRATSSIRNLEGLSVERVEGDLTDPASLVAAVSGVRRVFHCAADYRLSAPRPRELYESNVEGTRHILEAAVEAGAERIVYTSSVATLEVHRDGTPAVETRPASPDRVVGHYKRSKVLAERVAEDVAASGAPVVIVNPTTPVGEGDVKPTPTGKIIVDFLKGKMVATVDTGMNLVDVRDVAAGHLQAAERGRHGERYLLGGENLTLEQIFGLLAEITGRPAPRWRLPHWVPGLAARVENTFSRVLGRAPTIPLEGVKMSRYKMFADSSKAERELAFSAGPVREALARAVRWFQEHGYV